MKEQFTSIKLRQESLLIIRRANEIIESYQSQGLDMSLRQLYYQFISRDAFPDTWIDREYNRKNGLQADTKNTEKNYKRLGDIIADGRDIGLIDWDAIKDRGRKVDGGGTGWPDIKSYIRDAASWFTTDVWAEQKNYILVMVEKDALSGVLEPVCNRNRVGLSANKGYASASHFYEIGQSLQKVFCGNGSIGSYDFQDAYNEWRNGYGEGDLEQYFNMDLLDYSGIEDKCEKAYDKDDYDLYAELIGNASRYGMLPHPDGGKEIHVIYLGDHDPSGIDMSRDVKDRLELYSRVPVNLHRVALNMDQIRTMNPPPNPAKITDPRAKSYIEKYGQTSWELDALSPTQLAQLVEDKIRELRDTATWNTQVTREQEMKREIREVVANING